MDHVRVMGVCLLLIAIAVALPIGGPALASNGIAGSGLSLEKGGLTATTSPAINEIAYIPVSPAPIELLQAQENNTSVNQTEFNNTSVGNVTTEPNATLPQGVITPGMIPSENVTSSNVTPQENITSNVTNITPINETPSVPANVTPSENITNVTETTNITSATNVTNATNITNATSNVTFALNATPLENVTSSNVTANATNVTANVTTPEVTPVSSGEVAAPAEEAVKAGRDRIWRQGINPRDYTWDPQTFSGFFYDLKDEVGAETLTIKIGGSDAKPDRAVAENDLVYRSNVQDINYKFTDWGSYQVMGFMADKYFAGYGRTDVVDSNISLISDGQLRKVLIDTDDEHTITSGSVLPLEEGYELRIKEVDVNGNKAYMSLAKDGEEIDSKVISPSAGDLKSSTYEYKVTISGEDVPIIMAHINNVFASAESNLVTVNGLFQVSENYASVESGDKYGKMKVSSFDESGITMKNEDTLTLRKAGTINIFGNVSFIVADADELRFAPIVERTGTYTVRGTIVKPESGTQFTWDPYNFEGFYYNIDDDIGTERLTATFTGNSINEGDLVYETRPMPIKFKFEDWGKYDVIGFMADKYFAGYNNTAFTDSFSVINEGELRKVLIDSDDEQTISTGSVLALQEGYELRIKQVDINGNKVYLALAKDGKEVDSKVVTPSSAADKTTNYMYKVTIGSQTDVPIIVAHVQSVFRGTEADLATIDALFQVSDNPSSVESGEVYDKMKITSLSSDSIMMANKDSTISLGRDRTVTIMGNLKFQVADNPNRDLAPIAEKTSTGNLMTLSIPGAVVDQVVQINVKTGTQALSGVKISVAGQNVGNTDDTGNVSYTPNSTGSFDVVATKAGYGDAKGTLVVRTSAGAVAAAANVTLAKTLSINVPSEVIKGESFIITVTGGTNQTPMENVNVSFDNTSIGTTNADGTLTYSANETGEHTITAETAGYENATRKITVTSPIVVNSINVPQKASAGQNIQVAASVQNTGTAKDTQKLDLMVNGNVTDSKNVTLGPGENTTATFSYKPTEPGVYRISVDDKSGTVTVEKAQTNYALIALIVVILIAIGAGAYLYKTGELEELRKRLQGRQ